MSSTVTSRCRACETDLQPGAKFCRRCGLAVDEVSNESSERPTAMLPKRDGATTQQFEPRTTGRAQAIASGSGRRGTLIGVGLVLLVILLAGAFAAVWFRTQPSSSQLIYPGARTVLDMTSGDGSRTVHLQTSEPLDKVENWYQSNLKLTKTTRLTANSYILRNDDATITLVVEDNTTNIFIKQTP